MSYDMAGGGCEGPHMMWELKASRSRFSGAEFCSRGARRPGVPAGGGVPDKHLSRKGRGRTDTDGGGRERV